MLWLSKHQIEKGDPISEAKRQTILDKIRKESYEQPTTENGYDIETFVDSDAEPKPELRFRTVPPTLPPGATPAAAFGRAKYENDIKSAKVRALESWYDNENSLRIAQEAYTGKKITEIPDSENAYIASNHKGSIVEEQERRVKRNQVARLNDIVKKIMPAINPKWKEAMSELNDLIYAKTGLERNRVIKVRDYSKQLAETNRAAEKQLATKDKAAAQKLEAKNRAIEQQLSDDWRKLKDTLDADYDSGKITLAEYYDQIDNFIRTRIDSGYLMWICVSLQRRRTSIS
jgi:hypothetical protein